MTEKYISSLHIQKLGHEILEIRERALSNITSKLDHGFVYDNDLARSKEILTRLLEWFLHEPCTKQDLVFALIKRILKSQSGNALINHHGTATFREEIKRIRSYISPQFYSNLDEILFMLDQFQANNIVPPLETDIPLSYRTGQSLPSSSREVVGSTATTIEGFVQQDASAAQQAAPKSQRPNSANFVISPLKWQVLIEPDRHVLQSIESSVRRPPEPSSLLHSAEFFSNVLLQDFPAEIFLQRPYITLTFLDLVVKCPSTRIVNSILNGLLNLTRALQVRVNHHNDPAMFNSKDTVSSQVNSRASTPDSTSRKTASGQSDEETEVENTEVIKKFQITFPRYCYSSFKTIFKYLCFKHESLKKKSNRKGANLAFCLLEELANLLLLVLDKSIWNESGNLLVADVRKQLNEILIGYGVVLEHFRMEANCDDSNLNNRVFHLCILQNCANFLTRTVPLSQTGLLLPRNLKNALTNSLVDVTLWKLYPKLHTTLLEYVQSFSLGNETDSLRKFHETNKICESMSAAVEFLETSKFCEPHAALALVKKAMPCLEFHKDVNFVREIVDLASEKSQLQFDEVILKLLAHNSAEIQEEAYRLCQKKIIASIGARLNTACFGAPGSQILFLVKPQILVEVASHGLVNENQLVQNFADDILVHVLKCKILVSEAIWNSIVECLIISLPVLLCHANKTSSLGRTVLNLVDPDTAKSLFIPSIEVVRSNVLLLFCKESELREEAFSRLCWLLSSQKKSREMLPRLNNLHDKALPNVAFSHRVIDVNRSRNTQHFYQPSSLQQVLELLNSHNVEPVIRRSALTQISVMMEDSLLHSSFIERNGVETVLEVMQKALIEKEFENYPDSIIPAVGILKNICLFHAGVRQELSVNAELYFSVLRGLFLFFTEEKLKQDAVTLLFLLVFHDFVRGTPSKGDVSVPRIVKERLRVPFSCNTHWEVSPHSGEKLVDLVKTDRWCLSSVQIQWNLLMCHGFENLLAWNEVDYENRSVVECLRMSNYDLGCLKASAIGFCVRKYLENVQNSVNHENVIEAVNKLITYLHLYKITALTDENILDHQWEVTFGRFLKSLPSGEEDAKLLSCVLNFLKMLVPFYRNSDEPVWLIESLKAPKNSLIDLITLENNSSDDFKALSKDILALITACAINEQHFLDYFFYSSTKQKKNSLTWCSVIENIANNLKFSDSTHFYNLAYLDSLLSCLVHLTASLGWSKSAFHQKKLLSQLVASLCELVVVFHCGKGPTAAISVMGLSITRHVILVLNHLIAEMHYTKLKNWEDCFLDFDEEDWLKSFMILWSSRDVVLRAGALQLFAGLSQSPRLAINIVNELKKEKQGIWYAALALLTDQDEASVVRENSAVLLAHLTAHTLDNLNGDKVIVASLVPKNDKEDAISAIFNLFDDFQLYKCALNVLNALYTNRMLDFDSNLIFSEQNGDDSDNEEEELSGRSNGSSLRSFITTPALVKSLAGLLLNLHNLDSDRLSYKMQDSGLTKLIFRCACNPNMNIADTRKLSLYCEILEMNIAIFSLLTQLIRCNSICLGTVLHTKDCINATVSLLNKKNYHTHLPQLVYLRNRLWSEIFRFLTNLIDHNQAEEALTILSEAINDSGGKDFTEVLCEALSSLTSDELQNSALVSLTSLLKTESRLDSSLRSSKSSSLQNLLDTVRSTPEKEITTGCEICKILLNLYDLSSMSFCSEATKKRSLISATLSAILAVSREAQSFASECGLVNLILKQLKEIIAKLSLESVDALRRATDKKRLAPILKNTNDIIGLTTNFVAGSEEVKKQFAERGLCDFLHKLWTWFLAQKANLLLDVLQLLATFSADCPAACRAMTLTSSVAGSGPRKTPTKDALLHAIIAQVEKEMELTSKTHSLRVLELCLSILANCCSAIECRVLLVKSAGMLFASLGRLHPAVTKRQKVWESVELVWLEFLQSFSLYAEGQSVLAKIGDVFEMIVSLASAGCKSNKLAAMLVLRNVAFYQPNRARLLTSDEFLAVLQSKLESESGEERDCCVLIMWSLGANNQKAKIVFKAAQLDVKLEQVLRRVQLGEEIVDEGEIERAGYVLSMIRDGDKTVK